MANIFDVAKYILDSVGSSISAMKLQKLCYYSQAWHLAWYKSPLFEEDFKHSDNGPICSELLYIHQGNFSVSQDMIKNSLQSKEGLSDRQRQCIDQIIKDYGQYSGIQLSCLIHLEVPWKDTSKNDIISKKSMMNFYSSLGHN